jgi:hypothetical protein
MADILPFKPRKAGDKHKGKTLCRSGFHKWVLCQQKQFDPQQGRLVTVYRCARCHATKVKAL